MKKVKSSQLRVRNCVRIVTVLICTDVILHTVQPSSDSPPLKSSEDDPLKANNSHGYCTKYFSRNWIDE